MLLVSVIWKMFFPIENTLASATPTFLAIFLTGYHEKFKCNLNLIYFILRHLPLIIVLPNFNLLVIKEM